MPVPWSFARAAGRQSQVNCTLWAVQEHAAGTRLALAGDPTTLEAVEMVVINRGTCAAGRTEDKVKQVEQIAWSALCTCVTSRRGPYEKRRGNHQTVQTR